MDENDFDNNICYSLIKRQTQTNPFRFELFNPYIGSNYTKHDFDMRRKTEILKYKSNSTNRQTNNLTKKQIWSLISKGSYNELSQSQLSSKEIQDCSSTRIKYTPTSSSDVPGSVIYLYNDETVPLYNYNETYQNRLYGSEHNQNNENN